ncbi:unnamed protein product, partial [Closterium sp. NIES-54]
DDRLDVALFSSSRSTTPSPSPSPHLPWPPSPSTPLCCPLVHQLGALFSSLHSIPSFLFHLPALPASLSHRPGRGRAGRVRCAPVGGQLGMILNSPPSPRPPPPPPSPSSLVWCRVGRSRTGRGGGASMGGPLACLCTLLHSFLTPPLPLLLFPLPFPPSLYAADLDEAAWDMEWVHGSENNWYDTQRLAWLFPFLPSPSHSSNPPYVTDWDESAQDVEVVHQWEDDWDDDDVNDDFSQQLRAELEKST